MPKDIIGYTTMYANNKQELAKKRDLLDKEIYYSEGKGVLINDRINGLKSRLNPELNKKAIDLFLSLRYVPAPYTIYKGIKKLPVFHSLILEQDKISVKEKRVFNQSKECSYNQTRDKFKKALFEYISQEVRSEEKVALLLSGGIDSSTVLAVLSRFNIKIHTYTVGFNSKDPDLLISRKLAKRFSTEHQEVILEDFSEEAFDKVIFQMEQPVADPTYIPTRVLIDVLNEDIKKVFVGEGGDEVFGGYPEFSYVELGRFVHLLPGPLRSFASKFVDKEKRERVADFLRFYPDYTKAFLYIKSVFTPQEKEELYTEDFKQNLKVEQGEIFGFNSRFNFTQNIINFYLENQLPDRLLPKYPRGAKYKFCFPFLSDKIISIMTKAPVRYKFNPFLGQDKKILRDIGRELLPASVFSRKKRGFTVPLSLWMGRRLGKEIEKTLNKGNIQSSGRFNWKYVEKVLNDYDKNIYWRNKLWALFVLERWLKTNYEKNR